MYSDTFTNVSSWSGVSPIVFVVDHGLHSEKLPVSTKRRLCLYCIAFTIYFFLPKRFCLEAHESRIPLGILHGMVFALNEKTHIAHIFSENYTFCLFTVVSHSFCVYLPVDLRSLSFVSHPFTQTHCSFIGFYSLEYVLWVFSSPSLCPHIIHINFSCHSLIVSIDLFVRSYFP